MEKYRIEGLGNHPVLSREEELELAKRIRQGDQEARNRMIECNYRLVWSVIYKEFPSYDCRDDLFMAGVTGLCSAIDSYDYEKGNKLSTFAVWRIRRAIETEIDNLGIRDWTLSLDELIGDEDSPAYGERIKDERRNFVDDVVADHESKALHDAFEQLSLKEKDVLNNTVVLDLDERMPMDQLCKKYNLNRMGINAIRDNARRKLYNTLTEWGQAV